MSDTASALLEFLLVTLSLGGLAVLARTQLTKARGPARRPVPVRVERDRRER